MNMNRILYPALLLLFITLSCKEKEKKESHHPAGENHCRGKCRSTGKNHLPRGHPGGT